MILGAVIAGGRARRFGSDKALAMIDGRPMIDHVLAALAPAVDRLAICGRTYGDILALPDRPHADLGPLGGLNAALTYAAAHGYERVVASPCDTPDIAPTMLASLAALHGPAMLKQCPVIGVWPAALADHLDAWLRDTKDRSVRSWAASVGVAALDWAAPPNVNRPVDLAEGQSG